MPRSRTIIHEGPWTQQEPASLWKSGQLLIPVTEKKKQAGRRWVEYRKLLSPNIWTWAKSNNAKTALLFFFVYGREAAEICDIFLDWIGNLTEQGEDVSGSDPAQPAETGRKTHHPQRQRHRDVDPCLQYQKGSHTHAVISTLSTQGC